MESSRPSPALNWKYIFLLDTLGSWTWESKFLAIHHLFHDTDTRWPEEQRWTIDHANACSSYSIVQFKNYFERTCHVLFSGSASRAFHSSLNVILYSWSIDVIRKYYFKIQQSFLIAIAIT